MCSFIYILKYEYIHILRLCVCVFIYMADYLIHTGMMVRTNIYKRRSYESGTNNTTQLDNTYKTMYFKHLSTYI